MASPFYERETQRINELVEASIDLRRRRGEAISEAHSETHLGNVAAIAVDIAFLYNFSARELFLAAAAGKMHDMIRLATEDPVTKGDEASANAARTLLRKENRKGYIETTLAEQEAIWYAIALHGEYPHWLVDPKIRNNPPDTLEDKLHFALFVADKIEANGPRVIARRSSFVGGERLRKDEGDLRDFGFEPERDKAKAVALESAIRLTFVNPEGIYPDKLEPIVRPLYAVQREFVFGLSKALSLSTKDVAQELMERKNSTGKNMLEARNVALPEDIDALQTLIETVGGITNSSIDQTTSDVALSALFTVNYFSGRYADNLDMAIDEWQPQTPTATRWRQGMIEYAAFVI